MFEVRHLQASYGSRPVLKDVSFTAQPGTLTCILGANGCGKTTLLKAICGLQPHEGSCILQGRELEKLSSRQLSQLVGYIPQRSGISIDLTALEVAAMGFNPRLSLLQQPAEEMLRQARQALTALGLDPEENYLCLSEGQKQLCILARLQMSQGTLLLLDEPESALDLRNRYEMFDILRQKLAHRALLAAVHDPQLALQTADQLILLKDGVVDSVLHPATDSLDRMEQALCRIYGPVELAVVHDTVVMTVKGARR